MFYFSFKEYSENFVYALSHSWFQKNTSVFFGSLGSARLTPQYKNNIYSLVQSCSFKIEKWNWYSLESCYFYARCFKRAVLQFTRMMTKNFYRKTYVNYSPLFTLPLIIARTQVMEFKFLLIAFMVAIFLAQYEASSKTCPRWVKLNKSPVCFGARGDQFGPFSYQQNIFWARSCSCTTRERCRPIVAITITGEELPVVYSLASFWPIRAINHWLHSRRSSPSMDGTNCQVTAVRPQSFCSVSQRSLSASLPTESCICGMERISVALQAKVIIVANHVLTCAACWLKPNEEPNPRYYLRLYFYREF